MWLQSETERTCKSTVVKSLSYKFKGEKSTKFQKNMSLSLPTTPGHVSLPQHSLRIWTTLETLGKRVPEYFWYCLGMKLNLEQSICSISEKKSCISLACTSFMNLRDGCCSRSLWKLFWSAPVLPAPNTLSISFLLLCFSHILFILWKSHTLMQCSLFLSINHCFFPASLSAPSPSPPTSCFPFLCYYYDSESN